jgi:ABC-type glycerol-3-phosphate transport system substrate-binding protein
MQNLFLILLGALIVFSQVMTHRGDAYAGNTRPVLYWVTDPNPARNVQVSLFRTWLKSNGHGDITVAIDTSSGGLQKTIVQGVAGVAGDLIHFPGAQRALLDDIGLITDLKPILDEMGLPAFATYEAFRGELAPDGRVCAVPSSIGCTALFVNQALFQKLGVEAPPVRWSFEDFERIGAQFVAKANPPGQKHRVHFTTLTGHETFLRSIGQFRFNETLTACGLEATALAAMYERVKRWTFDLRLVPSEAERANATVNQGYGGSEYQIFHKGYLGMFQGGRHALIQLRQMTPALPMKVIELPNGGYPNHLAGTYSVFLYRNSKKAQIAKWFFAFLRSEAYNLHVVEDADGLPPDPGMLDRVEFLRPPLHTNEWGVHGGFAAIARETMQGPETSPYVYPNAKNIKTQSFQAFFAGVIDAHTAALRNIEGLNEEIAKFMARHPEKKAAYELAARRQKQIDSLKAAGKPVPAEWYANVVFRNHDLAMGRAFQPEKRR